ncbi:MAG: diaminopimelate epimerase [Caulobacterales bacterium 32-67-6]|nr:MAG: diaminopimelate epimerase [Caulobacterales bacterium 32-67-6]
MSRPFLKMNGLGNDFVVVEARSEPFAPSAEEVRAIADRDRGIGCDQLISLEGDRLLRTTRAGDQMVSVDMGEPGLDWTDIPLDEPMDTKGIELQVGPIDAPLLHTPGCVSMGNPHVVFFVDDIDTAPVREVGPMIEHHRLFPQGVNVGFAQVKARDHIRLRVWERGAGLTKACGTGACAALVACARRGLTDRKARLELDGGDLTIEWREADGHVIMTGPASLDFTGTLP